MGKIIHEYEVYHRLMRDAQVYMAEVPNDNIELNDEKYECNWVDFKGDPIIDIVFAESEDEAVKKVEEDTGYHQSNLYAIEHVVDAKMVTPDGKHMRFEASCYDDGKLCGIRVQMPDGKIVLICNDSSDRRNKIVMGDNMLSMQN